MSTSNVQAQQSSSLKALIAKGKEQNYLTYAEVNDHLPESISDPDQVEDIIQMIDDMGIKVFETAPDADQLLMIENETDELAAAEAAAAWLPLKMKQAVLLTLCGCTCVKWAPSSCLLAKAKSRLPSE